MASWLKSVGSVVGKAAKATPWGAVVYGAADILGVDDYLGDKAKELLGTGGDKPEARPALPSPEGIRQGATRGGLTTTRASSPTTQRGDMADSTVKEEEGWLEKTWEWLTGTTNNTTTKPLTDEEIAQGRKELSDLQAEHKRETTIVHKTEAALLSGATQVSGTMDVADLQAAIAVTKIQKYLTVSRRGAIELVDALQAVTLYHMQLGGNVEATMSELRALSEYIEQARRS